MQVQAMLAWKESPAVISIVNLGFAVLWRCSLFLDELEKYDKMAKEMRREDRRS